MTQDKRPTQVSTILTTLGSGDDPYSVELETYIAELETKQPVRPSRITAILTSIGLQYSADIETALEAYITDLEAKQQLVSNGAEKASPYDPENPPVWSYERAKRREQHRRERAKRKRNNYQGIKPL